MHRVPTARQKTVRWLILPLSLLLFAVTACTTAGGGSSGPNALEQFCDFYEAAEVEPPTPTSALLVKDDVVALADDALVRGDDCTDGAARVDLDGAVLAEGMEVPSELGTEAPPPIAAVVGEEISADEPVLDNLTIRNLSAEIGFGGITVRGAVAVTISGVTSEIGFIGTLQNLNNWSISLSSSSFTVPGIISTPATFSGILQTSNGVPSLSLQAAVSTVQIGDVTMNSATMSVYASPATGVEAAISGTIKVGPSTASGTVRVVFDQLGGLVIADADINVHLVGAQAGGGVIDLQGQLELEGNADETNASFSASGVIGDLNVNHASGSISMTATRATFLGVLDIQQGPNYVRFNGSIVWEGGIAYTPFLTLEAGGEYSGTLENGENVSVEGTLETTIVNGQVITEINGDFVFGTLKANGSAVVDVIGATTVLYVEADIVDAGFAAQVEGEVVLVDGVAESVDLEAAVQGPIDFGDVTLDNASLEISSSSGDPLEVSFDGSIQIGTQVSVSGQADAVFGPNGTLLSLDATLDANGTLQLDGWGILNFSGSLVATEEQATVSGSGAIQFLNFPAGITFNGTFSTSLTEPTWSFDGTGRFRLGPIDVLSARIHMSKYAGMRATRVGFYFNIIGIPTYFEGDFFLKPTGGCYYVNITGGGLIAKAILAGVLPGAIGCPVNT